MDNKVVIGIVIGVLVLILSVPILSNLKKSAEDNSGSSGGGTASTSTRSGAPSESKPAPPAPAPPLLNASNLVGSVWAVTGEGIPGEIQIECQANGVAMARSPLLAAVTGQDTITGTWKVEGAALTATVTALGQTQTVKCDIIGDKLYYKDQEIKRVR